MNRGRLEGRVAIVTGATGGIGRATAELFVREGASVMLVDLDAETLAEAAAAIGSDRVAFTAADVSDPAQAEHYVERTVARFGRVDVLFANAGVEGRVAPITSYPIEDLDRVLAVNVKGVFLGIRAAAPRMAKSGGGSVVVTSSVAGFIGSSGISAYVVSKHAVLGLVKCAAIELAKDHIRVNALNPGPIENRMMRSIESQAAPDHPELVKQGFLAMVPMGRYGTNEEMARVALFLASEESAYCTGAAFLADGGFVSQ